MNLATLISLALALLQSVLSAVKTHGGIAPNMVADLQAATDAILRVQGSDVTFKQLEGLRTTPKW